MFEKQKFLIWQFVLLQSTKPNRCTGAIITIKTTCKYLFGLKNVEWTKPKKEDSTTEPTNQK